MEILNDIIVKDNLTGIATSATKWATARTLSLTGDVTGSVSIDGSGNASIAAVITDDSHTHVTVGTTQPASGWWYKEI